MANTTTQSQPQAQTAIFAGGCFWCLEPPFDNAVGVLKTEVGYTGGTVPNPTYEQVVSGKTGHREAIKVTFDPSKTSYEKMVRLFFTNIDPFDDGGQFYDRGHKYTTAVLVADDAQRAMAAHVKAALENELGKKIVTTIEPASEFYLAEAEHQEYYQKNPLHYNRYKYGSGRPDKLERIWGGKE